MSRFRVGQGFDVHRFEEGRPLIVCGHQIVGAPGLGGHSDADVGLHAVVDAILGALADGDIGEHFGGDDPRWDGAASSLFVVAVLDRAAAAGYSLVNCDLTLIGERPRIAPHRSVLRRSLAAALGVAEEVVSVKATTTDGLGVLGRGEGLGALAVVLMERVDDDG